MPRTVFLDVVDPSMPIDAQFRAQFQGSVSGSVSSARHMVASPIEIPDALLQLIFTLVLTPAALTRCSLVCKDWCRILSSVALWRRITHKMCTLADSPLRYGWLVVRLKCPYGQFDIPLQKKAGLPLHKRTWIVPVPDGWHTFRKK